MSDLDRLSAIVEATPPVNWNHVPEIVVRFWGMAPELIAVARAARTVERRAFADFREQEGFCAVIARPPVAELKAALGGLDAKLAGLPSAAKD